MVRIKYVSVVLHAHMLTITATALSALCGKVAERHRNQPAAPHDPDYAPIVVDKLRTIVHRRRHARFSRWSLRQGRQRATPRTGIAPYRPLWICRYRFSPSRGPPTRITLRICGGSLVDQRLGARAVTGSRTSASPHGQGRVAEHKVPPALRLPPDVFGRIELGRQSAAVSCSQHDAQIIRWYNLAR